MASGSSLKNRDGRTVNFITHSVKRDAAGNFQWIEARSPGALVRDSRGRVYQVGVHGELRRYTGPVDSDPVSRKEQ